MKKLIFFGLLFLIPGIVSAERYMVEKPDGGVAIVYVEGESIESVLEKNQMTGWDYREINDEDIPASRADRNYWKFDSGSKKVVVDTAKKAQVEQEKSAKKEAVLAKLKITEQEARDLINAVAK